MIGYFSLSVPSGLSIYWLVYFTGNNNLISELNACFSFFFGIYLTKYLAKFIFNLQMIIYSWFRLTNNILSTSQQVWLRKLGGAKPIIAEDGSGIISAGQAKRSTSGER